MKAPPESPDELINIEIPIMTEPTELESLKARAKTLNIPFSANIGVETLRLKVQNALSDEPVAV